MELLVHNLLSLAIAVVAMDICIRLSAVLVPSFDRIAPKYLKQVTSAGSSPFIVMYSLVLVVLFTIIVYLFVLTSILYALSLVR